MIISYLAAPLMIISGVPQILTLLRTKDSTGVSLWMFYLTFAAVLLLFIEALRLSAHIIAIADACSLIMLAVNIVLIKKYQKNA